MNRLIIVALAVVAGISSTVSAAGRVGSLRRKLGGGATQGTCYNLGNEYAESVASNFCLSSINLGAQQDLSACLPDGKYHHAFVGGCKDNVVSLVKAMYDHGMCKKFDEYNSDQGQFILKIQLCESN